MISRTAIHAIRALAQLARLDSGSYSGAEALAETIGAPPNYLGKLLHTMSRAGLVLSFVREPFGELVSTFVCCMISPSSMP